MNAKSESKVVIFDVEKALFEEVVKHVAPICNCQLLSNCLEILADADENCIYVVGTDINTSVVKKIKASVYKTVKFCVDASLLCNIVCSMRTDKSDDLHFYMSENSLENESEFVKEQKLFIKHNGNEVVLNLFDSSEYPDVFDMTKITKSSFRIKTTVFISGLRTVMRSISKDNCRIDFTGASFSLDDDKFSLCATDGHRLSIYETSNGFECVAAEEDAQKINGLIIPRETCKYLTNILSDTEDIYVGSNGNTLVISTMSDSFDTTLRIVCINGKFPEFKSIIPQESQIESNVVVYNKSVLNAINLSKKFKDKFSRILFDYDVTDGWCFIKTTNPQYGTSTSEIEYDSMCGCSIRVALNCDYLSDVLASMPGETAKLCFIDASSPILIRDLDDESITHIIMPME